MTQPAPYAAKIDHLKTLLVQATDFAEPVDYLFDVLMADPAFRRAGEHLTDETIQSRFRTVLELLYKQLVGSPSPTPARLVAVTWMPEYQFAHGACEIGGNPGVIMYFRDLDMGLSAMPSLVRPGEVMFSRFSVYDPVGRDKSLHLDRSGRRH